MHAMGGIHSALAIKRQRKRRDEQRRARERRFSSQSTDSGFTASPRNSMGSLDNVSGGRRKRGPGDRKPSGDNVGSKVVTSIGMLHIGVVFLVLGAFLTVSGLLPDDFSSFGKFSSGGWFNELVCTGAFALAIGLFLIVLNMIISKKEEDELNDYVQRQLTRSKSGHRLIRDVETGCLATKQEHRNKMERRGSDYDSEFNDALDYPAPVHSPKSPSHLNLVMNGEAILSPGHLEKILEEEASEKGEEESRAMDSFNKEVMSNGSTTTSLSAGTPSETHELLSGSGRFFKMSRI
ncbi:hypothetical protein PR048_002806 [Dryococelus australis]|uniref:Uncharacterized protein n=1 Tax=Dryococelus australis TaxID=614101 RepID=A0ABQ9IMR0_9NEOP|nr:hypothetical protein PR048_002806 [Dryococelus australis]